MGAGALLLSTVLFSACGEDDGPGVSGNAVLASFDQTRHTIVEDDGPSLPIGLSTDRSVSETGRLRVTLSGSAVYGEDYTTQPAARNGSFDILFPVSSQVANFRVVPIETPDKSTDVEVIASLTDPQGGVDVGSPARTSITIESVDPVRTVIIDPVAEVFAEETNTLPQNIRLLFNRPTTSPATIALSVTETNMVLGQDYRLNWPVVDNVMTIEVPTGTFDTSFEVTFVDNDTDGGGKHLSFEIISATGGLMPGSVQDLSIDLEVEDDEFTRTFDFEESSFTINESPDGESVDIFVHANKSYGKAASLRIQLSGNLSHEVDYDMSPRPENNVVTLNFGMGYTQERITIRDINNAVAHGDRVLNLEMTEVVDGKIGASKTARITFVDDDD